MFLRSGAYDAGTFHAVMACVLARPLLFISSPVPGGLAMAHQP
jgi:hypothetical protein